ncbi:two-component sensor histidine kinase [Rhizobium laguerreae]|uniref:ATP-binding protein n=1 Tax=Rhizobium laguerreae TaxID=1076926 RepID=UPI001C8FC67C|nr:ATP-binding protein [Rhizobium laguerreae]MBY3155412.1 two-component sensor histidine kinase [Rhizobium laguerreae]
MKGFRTQVTLLLMTALILISVLSILATIVVYKGSTISEPRFIYRLQESTEEGGKPFVSVTPVQSDWEPDLIILVLYAALIASSSAVVSIIAGNMVVRPLETLQKAIESVDPQAIIPQMAERGDGAALITVRLLNTLSEKLRNAMDSRMRLVAAAGHDLRTPLTRMRLRAEMLEDETQRNKWIDDVDEMMHIADSAISLVKEEVGSKERTTIRLDELIEDIAAELGMIGHHVQIGRLDRAEIEGGPLAIKRAISNLLVNACTHGEKASVSVISNSDQVVCGIRDEGPGIPEDVIQNAFEPFFRADPARRKSISGAGLGLAIVKEIVSRHGGTITLANRHPTGLYQEVIFPKSG